MRVVAICVCYKQRSVIAYKNMRCVGAGVVQCEGIMVVKSYSVRAVFRQTDNRQTGLFFIPSSMTDVI